MTNEVEAEEFLVSKPQIIAAFTEWDRRYREEPDQFDSDFKRLLRGQTIEEYGEEATPYFLELLEAVPHLPGFALPA